MGGCGDYPYTSSTGHVTEYHDYHDYVHDHVSGSSTANINNDSISYGNMPFSGLSSVFLEFIKTHFAAEIDLVNVLPVFENTNNCVIDLTNNLPDCLNHGAASLPPPSLLEILADLDLLSEVEDLIADGHSLAEDAGCILHGLLA